ncbi:MULTISPECIES: beta-ketoacyl-ACP synthase 3 [unclassified Streptomyces]|uniref:beta-ketoacyl-ACP synthase 3 n=1 Tax=unclassified Streptomyces TaxID=2593676 RepID=UPI00225B692D|nr:MULTISPECIES: beta-ketoacyl-ACP synthase 3 [unclassified Streptomyces]MCX5053057.1 beta-ketoacyl-ACP synthase 3 [Streptomyces sp. NBC_00474]
MQNGRYAAQVSGIGRRLPALRLTNDEIAAHTDITAEWIQGRSGVETRHHAGDDEPIVQLAADAALAALEDAGLAPVDIDAVIVATTTLNRPMPGAAAAVASLMGCGPVGAFDINAACAGFAYAVAVAADLVRGGTARHVVVVGAERLSDWTAPQTPDTFAILGDGAGAAVVSVSAEDGISRAVWGSDGTRADLIAIPAWTDTVQMRGPLVYKWATTTMPDLAREVCAQAGLQLGDLDWLVLHQANIRIIDGVAADLGVPADRVARDVVDRGNTSAASIPLALAALRADGRSKPGQKALLLGFGAGLTYAGLVIRLP